ncbi:MAG: fibrinogen-like YCDxxxxGGGW domain-containing protein, partial [Bacteroidales bacterium]|nr:fibrinogen-like YCDxxxxGGGW domain-containing protein [Bacteroidales bacterium]
MIPRVLLTFIFLILIVDNEFAIDAKTRLHTDLTYPYSRESKTVTELFSPLSAPVVALTSVKINTGGSSVSSSYNLVATLEPEAPNQTVYNWMIKPQGAGTYEPIKVLEMNMNGGARESGKVKDYISGNNGTEKRSIIFRPHRGLNDGTDNGSVQKGKDAYVWRGSSNQGAGTNNGTYYTLFLDYYSPRNSRVYIQFDISELTSNVSNVTVNFPYLGRTNDKTPSMSWKIKRPSAEWQENIITWNNQPSLTEDYGNISIPNYPQNSAFNVLTTISKDITSLYNGWKDGTIPNYGIALTRNSTTGSGTNNQGHMGSSDNSNPDSRPYLLVSTDVSKDVFYLSDGDEDGMGAYSCNGVDHIELDNAIDLSGKTVYMKIKRGSDWEHIISTPDRTYINGTEQDYDIPFDGKNIGIDKYGAGFNGIIDRVVVYNRVLSAEQITLLSQGNESTILNGETLSGETWKLCVITNDNANDETEICSNEITIQQPEIDQVTINNSATEVNSLKNLTATVLPESSDKLIYNWQVDDGSGNKSVKTFDMPMDGGDLCESKVCEYSRNLNGTISGGVSYINNGGFDGSGAYSFDGTGGSISVGGLSDFNYIIAECNFTISLWARTNEPNGSKVQYFMGSAAESASDRGFFFGTDGDGKLTLGALKAQGGVHIFNFASKESDGVIFEDTDFHHVVVTCDYSLFGSDRFIKYYVDGELKGVGGASNSAPTNVNASRVLTLGRINGWPHGHFNGVIDGVKIWNRVLSPAQIKVNYQNRSDNVVVYDQTKTGDKWKVTVTPNDNSNNGDSKDSQEVLITAPALNSVVINSNATGVKSTENLIATTDDAVENNIKKIYNWQVDDGSGFKPVKIIDIPMDCGATADGNSKIEDYINGYNAIPNNVTYDRFGGFDSKGCYNFNGTDSYLSIDADESVFDLAGKSTTVTMWVKLNPSQTEDFSTIFDKGHASEGAKSWYILTRNTEDKISFGYGDGTEWDNAVFTTSPVLDNTWKFLVCIFDEQTLKIYLNGELEDTHNVSEQPADNDYNLEFGMWNREGVRSRFLKGSIDEIKIYNRALSKSQIETMYNDYKTTGVFKENIIVADQTRTREKWRVDVTPSDNFSTGITKSSNEVTITPITIQEIKLNSGVSNAMSADNLTATVTSNDSERIIYKWEVKEQGKQEYRYLKQLQLPFDGGAVSGKVKDYISNTEWTVNNKALYVSQGGINGTGFYSFDGTENSNIYHNNIPEFDFIHNDFTIEFWVMLNKDQDMGFTGQSDGSGAKNKWMLRYMQTEGGLNWHVNSSSGNSTMHTWPWSPETGKIYYISLVRKGDKLTLYINGVKQDNDHTVPFEIPGQSGRFYIGHVGENEPVMDGAVDEFTVWQKALSAEQISVMYNNYTTSQTTKRDVITSLVTNNGDSWRVTAIPHDGFSAGEPKTSNEVLVSALSSCKEYKEAGYTEDRLYEIDPDGSGDIAPFVTWCDMTGEGYNLDLNENANTAMRSCREHLTYFPDSHTKDGIYLLDIDGADGDKQPFKAWCDMTTDGGGWTALLNPVDNNLSAAHPDVQATQYASCSNCNSGAALKQDDGENIIQIYRCGDCSAWAKLSWTNTIDAKEVMFRAYAHAYNSNSYIYLNGSVAHTSTACGSSNKFALGDNSVCNTLICASTSWLTSKPSLIRDFTGNLTIQVGGVSSGQNINGCYNHTGWGGGGRIVTVFVREDKRLPEYLPKISCKDHKRSGKTENGVYKIDPDGDGNIAPFEVYCDMTSDDLTILSESSNTGLKSCSEHLRYYPDNKNNDGIYLLDPDGASGDTEPFKAWCDMTTEGGGWTLLMNLSNTGTPFGTFNGSTIVDDYWQKTETINDETITPITDYKSDRAKYNAYNWVNGQEYKLQMLLNSELPSEKELNWKYKFSNESTAKSIFSGSAQYVVSHLANSCGNYFLQSEPYYDGSMMKFAKGKQAYGFNFNVYSHGVNYANAKMKWGFGSNDETTSNMNAQYGMFYTGSVIWSNASDCDGGGCGCYGTGSNFSTRMGRLWTRDTENDMTMFSVEKSCMHHYLKNRKVDGIYKIDPDGDGSIAEFQTWCDMTTDGGGWTLVHKNDRGSDQANDKTDAGYNLTGLQSTDIDGTAILPRETIEQLGNEFRLTTDSENHKAYWRFNSQNEVFYNTIPDVTDNDIACEMKVVSYDNEWKTAKLIKTNNTDATHVRIQDSEEMHFLVRRDCCGSFGSFWFNNGIWWDDSRPDKGSYHPGMVWVRNNTLSVPEISEFNSSAIRVDKDEEITFNWTVTGATKIELLSNNDINFTTPTDVTGTTEKVVIPDSSSDIITYTLRAINNEGFVTERDITIFRVNGIPYSLRFNKSNINYLQRDINSSGDRKKWVFSAWVKLVNPGVDITLLGSSGTDGVRITAEGRVAVVSGNMGHETNERIQNVDNWHHIYVQVNSGHADASERKKIWINGVQSTFVNAITDANFPQNTEGDISQSGKYIYIGKTGNTTVPESDRLSDMYITELFFIDGGLPGIDKFGTDKDGVWTEVSSSVNSCGDNGFYLNFYDQTNIGYDFSGNRNHFTPKGYETRRDGNKYIDQMLDSPTRNFAVFNTETSENVTLSSGLLQAKVNEYSGSSERFGKTESTLGFNRSKYSVEYKLILRGDNGDSDIYGTLNDDNTYAAIRSNGLSQYVLKDINGSETVLSNVVSQGDNIQVYSDFIEDEVIYKVNGNEVGRIDNQFNSGSVKFFYQRGVKLNRSTSSIIVNFGQGGQSGLKNYKIDIETGVWTEVTDGSVPDVRFSYSPPTGFYPLNEAFVSPEIGSFTADPTEVSSGSTTDLSWSVTGSVKEELWLDGEKVADITGQSPYTITPPEEPGEYTYTLKTYSGAGLVSTKEVKITVTPGVSVESVQINDNNVEYRSNQRLEAVYTGLNPTDGNLIYNWFVDRGSGSNTIADVIIPFDGNSVNDQSGNNNNGALHDDESDGYNSNGKYGVGYEFDGINDYIEMPTIGNLFNSDFSYS